MLMDRLQRLLPRPEQLQHNRWLRWMGPALLQPRLWRFSRRGTSIGLALGVFFGLLIPLAQIPCSAAAAIVLRANLPAAVASTLVTNPVTFGPIYYTAYRLGRWMLGDPAHADDEIPPMDVPREATDPSGTGWLSALGAVVDYATTVGKPLILGLAVLAFSFGLLTYWLSSAVLAWRVRRQRSARVSARLGTAKA